MRKKKKSTGSIQIIKKSNQLIEARYRFDIWETRIFLSVLSCIRRDDNDLQPYRIWYKDIIKVFGLRSHQSYALLRNAAKSLMSHTFKVNNKSDGFNRVTEYHIIKAVNYLTEGQEGKEGVENQEYLDITIEPEMKPLLLQLQRNFTAYDLKNVAKLGAQPVRLYELLKQYESIGNRNIEVEELRRMLIYENEYPKFSDFFRYFIKPAIKDINKYTDLDVYDIEKKKRGRRIQSIHFHFRQKSTEKTAPAAAKPRASKEKKKATIQVADSTAELFDQYHGEVVEKFGVTPSVFLRLLSKYSSEQVEQAIRVTHRAKYNQQIKSSVGGFFVKALKDGFTDEKEEKQKRQKQVQQNAERKAQLHPLVQQYNNLLEQYTSEINNEIRAITDENPKVTQRAIKSIKKTYSMLGDSSLEKKRINDFRQEPILRGLVKAEIMKMFPNRFETISSGVGEEVQAAKESILMVDSEFVFE